MLHHEFPDLAWLKNEIEQNFASQPKGSGKTTGTSGWPTVVLNVKTQDIYRDDIRGPLSIFTNLSGESAVTVDKRGVRVNEGFFFVSNQDQRYTLEVEPQKKAETFNIHFGQGFTNHAFSALSHSCELILEGGDSLSIEEPFNFHNKISRKTKKFDQLLRRIQQCGNDELQLDETLFELYALLVNDNLDSKRMLRNIPALRRTTKEELLKRLFVSTDYIHSFYDHALTLDEIAESSCLSKFHFLRLFKTVLGKTPHQYLNEVRCERARNLLIKTSMDVTLVAKTVGFNDASSFSRMFFNSTGVYPSRLRNR